MLKKWIYDTTITLQDSVESWPQALEICAKPLLELQVIAPGYVTAIIEQHHTLGPYYVLARAGHAACAAGRGQKDWASHY